MTYQQYGLTLVRFVSVCWSAMGIEDNVSGKHSDTFSYVTTFPMTLLLKTVTHVGSSSGRRRLGTRLVSQAMNVFVRSCINAGWKGFFVSRKKLVEWKCVPILMSCTLNNIKNEKISVLKIYCCSTEDICLMYGHPGRWWVIDRCLESHWKTLTWKEESCEKMRRMKT